MSKSKKTSLMSSQSDFEDVDMDIEPGAAETRSNIEIIGQVNDELGELTRVLNTRRTGNSTPTFKSLNAELDVFRTNLNGWLNDATARVDDEMVDTYAGTIESLFLGCPRGAAKVGSIILTSVTEKYESIFEEQENKPLPPMNLELKNNKSKIVQLLDMVGTGLESAGISHIKSTPSNLWSAIKDLASKTTEYVSANSGNKCKDSSTLALVKQLNSDTEGYFTGNEGKARSSSSSSSSSSEKSSRSQASSKKSMLSAAFASASAATSRKKSKPKSKAKAASMYDADSSQQFDEDEDEEFFARGFKKSLKRTRKQIGIRKGKKCKNKSVKKCLYRKNRK